MQPGMSKFDKLKSDTGLSKFEKVNRVCRNVIFFIIFTGSVKTCSESADFSRHKALKIFPIYFVAGVFKAAEFSGIACVCLNTAGL